MSLKLQKMMVLELQDSPSLISRKIWNFHTMVTLQFWCCHSTVWKFHNFSITQILRDSKVGDFRGAKSAILTHFEALIFLFWGIFCPFCRPKIYQNTKFRASENAKMAVFQLPETLKLISRNVWVIETFWILHTVFTCWVWYCLDFVTVNEKAHLVCHFTWILRFSTTFQKLFN